MTGIYTSAGDAARIVKNKFLEVSRAAIAAAGETEVDVAMGFVWPARWQDAIAITSVREAPNDGTAGIRGRQHADIRQDLAITVARTTGDEQEVHDRAFELLDIIDTSIRANPNLDQTVLWTYADEVSSDGITDESDRGWGRLCALSVTYVARVMITRPA